MRDSSCSINFVRFLPQCSAVTWGRYGQESAVKIEWDNLFRSVEPQRVDGKVQSNSRLGAAWRGGHGLRRVEQQPAHQGAKAAIGPRCASSLSPCRVSQRQRSPGPLTKTHK